MCALAPIASISPASAASLETFRTNLWLTLQMSNPRWHNRPMQNRLLSFFGEVRNVNPQILWTFQLKTNSNESWPESMLAIKGMPTAWTVSIVADAQYQIRGKWTCGFLAAQRSISPRKAARDIMGESRTIVADVMDEFAGRISDFR
jgi:hypothetical protein